jgi:phosphatidylethanolamine-binding protein (PEBP) family uncharacterized protein
VASHSASKKTESLHLPEVVMPVTSSAFEIEGLIPARYTCDGKNESPQISWTAVPANSTEVLLFITNYTFVHGRAVIDWAVGGLSPKLHGVSAGKLPHGAVVGRNSLGQRGYSLCPPKGGTEKYAVGVLPLRHSLRLKPGFDGVTIREHAIHKASVEGLLDFNYKRS